MPAPVILLACGCYNPVTYMHLRMFEIARDYLHRMGQYEVIGGVISPVHDSYGKKGLISSKHRLGMLKAALQDTWIKISDYEAKQESWSRTKNVLQFHQNQVNAFLHSENSNVNEEELKWMPKNLANYSNIVVKLLCGADLLESFGTPNLWADEDIEAIVGQHGLIVITRSNTNPNEFIYNSDILTKLMPQIQIVTEWIGNEISSTRIRTALRRSESVKYLIPDKVIDYIFKNQLYGVKSQTKYSIPPTPESPQANCLYICNLNRAPRGPGQAVKVIATSEVRIDSESKNCDENLIKFIFSEHGIRVISDVETIV